MPVKIKIGPPQLSVHQDYVFMVSDPDGQILTPCDKGLYYLDTRLINAWAMFADGEAWTLLNSGALLPSAARIYATNPPILTAAGTIAEKTLGLVLSRRIDGGMRDDIDITNHNQHDVRFNLEIMIRVDFADLFEVRQQKVARRGKITTEWSPEAQALTNCYRHKDFSRSIKVAASGQQSPMVYANGRLSFYLTLAPGAVWHTSLLYSLADNDTWLEAPEQTLTQFITGTPTGPQDAWRASVLKLQTDNKVFETAYAQALSDMYALRLPVEDLNHVCFVPAAGLPWFVALFGRDTLVISLQNSIIHPEFALATLIALAKWQATERDDYRDAEPGKILHELRRGELAHFHMIPHTPYYGTADATPLYLTTLHTAWMSTGDRDLLTRHIGTAERCLEWIDRYGDRDGDGLQEYETRSPAGLGNQSWKDSGDSVMYLDGSLVKGPKALCELQGYVYDAWLRMACLYDALGRAADAAALRAKAAALYRKFNEVFWNEAEGFYAFALDGDKRPVLSVASNPGHCLWSGIVPPERAGRVVQRLLQPDMSSGWGIRTLSATHKSFNPFNYQTGAVWPHDNGFIALGMKRYGFHAETCEVAEAITRAAGFFVKDQLPELYTGTQRDDASFPVQYLGANVPQGWAAGTIFALLHAMLGYQPDAPNERLYLDPVLPDWMPDLTLRDLRVGGQCFDIRFASRVGVTSFEVLRGDADAVLRRPMTEWHGQLRQPTPSAA